MNRFDSQQRSSYGRDSRERVSPPSVKRTPRDNEKVFRWVAAVFLTLVIGASLNAWITRTTWEEYHLKPEDSLSSQFDYVEVYPGNARSFGPYNAEENWGYHGKNGRGGYYSNVAEKSCVNTIEASSIGASREEDRYESVLWYGMEYRGGEWVVTASTYKPFGNGEMRLLECYTKEGVADRIIEFDRK